MQLSLYASLHFQRLLKVQGLVISVHMPFLQLTNIESVTSQLV